MTSGVRRNPLWHLLRFPIDTDDCIVWTNSRLKGKRPYGQVRYQGKLWLCHRVSFLLHRGAIPEGMDVCHTCDNPPCWNPRHLFIGTRKDNMQDSKIKGRNFIPTGEKSGRALFTDAQIKEIRALYKPKTRGLGYKCLAKRFGISAPGMQAILNGKNWSHLK